MVGRTDAATGKSKEQVWLTFMVCEASEEGTGHGNGDENHKRSDRTEGLNTAESNTLQRNHKEMYSLCYVCLFWNEIVFLAPYFMAEKHYQTSVNGYIHFDRHNNNSTLQYAKLAVLCPSSFYCMAPQAHFPHGHSSCCGERGRGVIWQVNVWAGRWHCRGETAVSALPAITASQTFRRRHEQSARHPCPRIWQSGLLPAPHYHLSVLMNWSGAVMERHSGG